MGVSSLEMRAAEALDALLRDRPAQRSKSAPTPAPATDLALEVESLCETGTAVDRESPDDAAETVRAERRTSHFSNDDIRAAARERLFLDRHYADLRRDLSFKPGLVQGVGGEPRLKSEPPVKQPRLPPRPIPSALAGASSLILGRSVSLPPPRAP